MAEEKKEKFSSIFDAVSKMERRKVVEKVLSAETRDDVMAQKAAPMTDEDIAQKLEQYKKLHNLLADSLEQIFVKNNLSPSRLREYFSTSRNFSAAQWDLIEKERHNIDAMIARLIPYAKRPIDDSIAAEKKHQVRPKKMQVKSRWTPMR